MTTLKAATLWCCRLQIPWTADDVAAMAAAHPNAVKAYLNRLADQHPAPVRRLDDGRYQAGDTTAIHILRTTPTNAKPGGGSADYRKGKAARDRLLEQEGAARRAGELLTSQGVSSPVRPDQIRQADFSAGYLTADESCSLLHVSRATLYRLIRAGHLPTGRLPSGHRRIGAADVQRFMKTIAQGAQP